MPIAARLSPFLNLFFLLPVALITLLADEDLVGLTIFADSARCVLPLTEVNAQLRCALASAVRSLHTEGSTNLSAGLQLGIASFSAQQRTSHCAKLLLLSDGEANRGEVRASVLAEQAANAALTGVTLSTLGVGFSYNSQLMAQLADCGSGDFHHIEHVDSLTPVHEELLNAAHILARGVVLDIALPDRLAVADNLNGYRQETTDAGIRLHLGDLPRVKDVLFEVTSPVALEGENVPIQVRVTAQGVKPLQASADLLVPIVTSEEAAQAQEEATVIDRVASLLKARAVRETISRYEVGDHAGAAHAAQRMHATIGVSSTYYSPSSSASFTNAANFVGNLEQGAQAQRYDQRMAKEMFRAGYDATRSRTGGTDELTSA